MKKILFPLGALAAFALLACAPINENQCKAGNWEGIGLRDGANGRSETHVTNYVEECGKFGTAVDLNAWRKGRTEGLKSYCTLTNAENVGRNGRALRPVCANSSTLFAANRHGQVYHELTNKLEDLEDERDELRAVLNRDFRGELTEAQAQLGRRYLRRLRGVEDDISDLKYELRRFPRYS